MKNLKLFTVILFLFSLTIIQAQEAKQLSIVHLKDGSFLKGEVLNQDVDNVQLKLFTGETMALNMNLIASIVKQKQHRILLSSGHTIKTKGRYFSFQFNSLVSNKPKPEWEWDGYRQERRYGVGGSLTFGYRFNQYLGIGLGAGFDAYGDYILPVFLDIRGSFLKKRISPSYKLNIGYGIPVGGVENGDNGFIVLERRGGFMLHPSIGFRVASRKESTFFFDLGYKFQHLTKHREYDQDWFWDGNRYVDNIWYKSFAVRFGWEF